MLARDVFAVLRALAEVEIGRRRKGPGPLLASLRARGRRGARRSPEERDRLRRIIARIDGRFPGGGNCYRRALLEIAVDPTAADEPLRLGLQSAGGVHSGHAWLPSSGETSSGRYDAEFSV